MAQVRVQARLGAAPEDVWKVAGDFVRLIEALIADLADAHVEYSGEGIGMERKVTVGPDTAVERLEEYDAEHWRTSYSMPVTGPFPIKGYYSTIQLERARDGGCELTWTGTFEPDGAGEEEAAGTVRRIYEGGVEILRARFGA